MAILGLPNLPPNSLFSSDDITIPYPSALNFDIIVFFHFNTASNTFSHSEYLQELIYLHYTIDNIKINARQIFNFRRAFVYINYFYFANGFIVGNNRTSLIEPESVRSITSRSSPNPSPPVGGIPYSRAVMKSSSTSALAPCARLAST